MKIEEICEYLNELGILSINKTPLFLSIYTGLIGKNNKNNLNYKTNNDIDNYKLIIILFAFLKKIISSDKELYELCSNIINSHTKNKLIKQYQGLCFLNKVIFYQIKNRYNHFLFLLFKKKYPKRKFFPYNPLYAVKSVSKLNDIKPNTSFTNLNPRMNNNFLNINDEYSLSYISNKNNNRHYNKIVLNTGSEDGGKNENSRKKNILTNPPIPEPDLVEKMNLKKKEISLNNMKKKLYDAQIRINNYENIIPISRRNREKELKSREEEDYYKKLKEDKIYQKLTEKELDANNILDRLYRKEIIKKQEKKMKDKDNKKRSKSPIDWDKVNSLNSKKKYLNININSEDINSIKEIINKPQKNFNSSREMFSFGNPVNSGNNQFNQNDILNNNNDKIDYNEYIKNKKENLPINEYNKKKLINYNEQNNSENVYEDANKNINNNIYPNLKQLDENQMEQNMNQKEVNEHEPTIDENNKNMPHFIEKYTFGKVDNQKNNNNKNILLNKENENKEEKGNKMVLQKVMPNDTKKQEKDYNLLKIVNPKINSKKIIGNEEEENEIEELIYDNENINPSNEQNEYQYENIKEEEEEDENNDEEYDLENEEIEYDLNNMNNNEENEINMNNSNENEKIGNENINYEDVLAENIDECVDEEDTEK